MSDTELNLEARQLLLPRIADVVRSWDISQPKAALRLGTSQPRINVLLKEKIELFSLCNLIELSQKVGLDLTLSLDGQAIQLERIVVIEKPPKPKPEPRPKAKAPAKVKAPATAKDPAKPRGRTAKAVAQIAADKPAPKKRGRPRKAKADTVVAAYLR